MKNINYKNLIQRIKGWNENIEGLGYFNVLFMNSILMPTIVFATIEKKIFFLKVKTIILILINEV